MTQTEFTAVLKDFLERSIGEAQRKRPDYAEVQEGRDDVLANFKEVGRRTGMTALQCAMVYFEKHLITLEKYTRGLKLQSEGIDGRLVDLLNYLTLIAALIVELRRKEQAQLNQFQSAAKVDLSLVEPVTVGPISNIDEEVEVIDDGQTANVKTPSPLKTFTNNAFDTIHKLFPV